MLQNAARWGRTDAICRTLSWRTQMRPANFPSPSCDFVFVLGGPGSGKGTQCRLLAERYGLQHVSAGELLRAHSKSGSGDAEELARMLDSGQIVPAEITVELLQRALRERPETPCLIDGFPRNTPNLHAWQRVKQRPPLLVLQLDVPPQVMLERITLRRDGRADDNPVTLRKRLQTHTETAQPVLEHFAASGHLVRIDASMDVPVVFEACTAALRERLPHLVTGSSGGHVSFAKAG